MNVKEALITLDQALLGRNLTTIEETVFCEAWAGKTYPEIAATSGYEANYIKNVGYKLWKLLSQVFEQEVTKSNLRSVFRRQYFAQHQVRSRSVRGAQSQHSYPVESLSASTDDVSSLEKSVASLDLALEDNDEQLPAEVKEMRSLNYSPLKVILTTLNQSLYTQRKTDTAVPKDINAQVLQLIDGLLKNIFTSEVFLSNPMADKQEIHYCLRT